eukprot:m.200200 g.200200  ORF g.200200 m.200200 type:complete len:300 (+) comp14957_c0_seq4:83-982(+)
MDAVAWSVRDQLLLCDLVQQHGVQSWSTISKLLKTLSDSAISEPAFHSAKQCAQCYGRLLEKYDAKRGRRSTDTEPSPHTQATNELREKRKEELKMLLAADTTFWKELTADSVRIDSGNLTLDQLQTLLEKQERLNKEEETSLEALVEARTARLTKKSTKGSAPSSPAATTVQMETPKTPSTPAGVVNTAQSPSEPVPPSPLVTTSVSAVAPSASSQDTGIPIKPTPKTGRRGRTPKKPGKGVFLFYFPRILINTRAPHQFIRTPTPLRDCFQMILFQKKILDVALSSLVLAHCDFILF